MNAVATQQQYTPEDLLALPDEKDYELVDGNLVERNVSLLSSWVGGRLHIRLGAFVEDNDLGTVWPADNGFQCFPDAPGKVRKPDVSFIRRERFSTDDLIEGYLRIPPDLVVEVISPNDLAWEVEAKVDEYLRAGVRLVWIIDPHTRTVRIHRDDGTASRLRPEDEISGEDVIPGFRCAVRDLFPPPRPAGPAA
ncbi:MAG TPA: Uma2 family endonuclease [Isosphaeraceae bacterium]|jgi:Uma2 family endonuclease